MSNRKINIGIIGNAKIAREQLIPAIKMAEHCKVLGIASRNLDSAKAAAAEFGIEKAYGSYEDLLQDADIDAVYIPLPNHLHVAMSIQALQAGKHVLCEKPIACNAADAQKLLDAASEHADLKIMEAFMYRFHPVWQKAKQLANDGTIGTVRAIQSFLSFHNTNADDVRNKADIGGGGLLDLGCYNISFSRFIFDAEPQEVKGIITRCPKFNTDIITSGLLLFSDGRQCSFTCSTQLSNHQSVKIVGDKGVISFLPLYAISDYAMTLNIDYNNGKTETVSFEQKNHYTLQCDAFAQSIINHTPVPTPLSDALANMKTIDKIFESAKK